jgi:hypothetical protein
MSFASINLCVASQRVFIGVAVVVYFVMDSVRKLLDTPSAISFSLCQFNVTLTLHEAQIKLKNISQKLLTLLEICT